MKCCLASKLEHTKEDRRVANTASLNGKKNAVFERKDIGRSDNFTTSMAFFILAVSCCSSVRGEMLFVEQRVGDSLRLPCDVIPPLGDAVAVILWYRDKTPTAIYTYDARNESLGFQQHTPRGPDLASRASFYHKPPAALTITGALPEDSGIYQCRVDFTQAPSRTTKIQAVVVTEIKDIEVVRASPPVGSTSPSLMDRTVEASLHQPLRLICRTAGGPPSSVDLVDFPEAFTSGEPHPLSCRVYGSRPRPRLEWSLTKPDSPAMKLSTQDLNDPNFWSPVDGGGTSSRVTSSTAVQTLQLSSSPSHSTKIDRTLLRKQSYSSGQLKVVLGKEDHGGKLSCVAWNNFFPNYKVNATKTIHVNYAPEVELELGVKIDPSQVREGTDLYFTCKVDSRPPADQLSWTHKNRTLKNDPVLGVLMSGEHLVLQSVTRDWSGTFSCTAANSVASVVSNTINISILCELLKQ
ncbi:uncharacterized protein LOC108665950 [Hyalella azteca]|uniref:Uncharacterized protein LOC108665950 n=1 Tax=Hyalella azteca TaxID=294128 RepID=A0A979FHB6_HYAAZ|nr:uncharacterized protein LOC108665950 [Hyalella azteca]